METYDTHEQLAHDASSVAAILANPTLTEFELLELGAPRSEQFRQRLQDTGFYFVGTIGLVNGLPRTALSEPLSAAAVSAIHLAFTQLIENQINESLAASADDVTWLNRLFSLPDMRRSR